MNTNIGVVHTRFIEGSFVGRSWGGFKAELEFKHLIDPDKPVWQEAQRILKTFGGDFQRCEISEDALIRDVVVKTTAVGDIMVINTTEVLAPIKSEDRAKK